MGFRERLNYNECPVCGGELDVDTAIYIAHGEIIGCEMCVNTTYPSVVEEDLNELAQDAYDNYLWDMSQEMKALMSCAGGKVDG